MSSSQFRDGPDNSRGQVTTAKFRAAAVLLTLLFPLFLAALDFSIILTAVPYISHQLHSQTAYVWIGSAYLLSSAAVAPVYGKVSDIWGRKGALLGAIALFFVGSAICGWSQDTAQMILGRAVQGSGAGGIIVLVNISISDVWSARHRGMFLATTGLVWAISAGLGPLLGGLFAQYSTWRWAFWINLPCSFAAFVVLYFILDTVPLRTVRRDEREKMDWVGSVTIISMTILILLSLDFGGVVVPWNSPKVYTLLISGGVLLAVFVFWETRGTSNPLIPVRLLDNISKACPLLVCFAHGFVNVSSWYYLPLYFQAVRGASPVRSGVLLMPIVVVQALVGVFVGGMTYRFGWVRSIIWFGMALTTTGFSLFITLATSTSLARLFTIEIVTALGVGAVFQAPLIAYQAAMASSADMAVATALFGFVRSLSTSVSVVVGGVVFQNSMHQQADHLKAVLGDTLAQNFSASNAASNVMVVRTLSLHQQVVVKEAYISSLHEMWKMYASVAGLGALAALFIKKHSFTRSNREGATVEGDGTAQRSSEHGIHLEVRTSGERQDR